MSELQKIRFLGADGLEIFGDVQGDGPPVLFLHGGGQTRRAWRVGMDMAVAAGFKAVALDQRGHGDSGWAADGDYSPEAFARDIEAIAPEIGKPLVLVGASRGGQGAIIAAGAMGADIRALALVEITPQINEVGAEEVRNFMRASAAGFATLAEAAAAMTPPLQTRLPLKLGWTGKLEGNHASQALHA